MRTLIKYAAVLAIGFVVNCEAKPLNSSTERSSRKVAYNITADTIGQGSGAILSDGRVIEIDGYDVSMYDLDLEYLDVEVSELNKDFVLCIAATECDLELTRRLLIDGADPNMICDVDHILTEVSFCGEYALEITQGFLNAGSNVNGADEENASFLSYSIMEDNIELVEFLLDNGANPSQRSTGSIGCLPVHNIKSIEMLLMLIERKVDITTLCENGRNLLHQAIRDDGSTDLAKYLIKKRLVDLGAKDDDGETPLDYAIRFKRTEIVKLLSN